MKGCGAYPSGSFRGTRKLKEKKQKKKDKSSKKTHNLWPLKVFFIALCISAVLSFAADRVLSDAGILIAVIVLAVFIILGIIFDMIGVAATAANPAPFHAMASHKEKGGTQAIWLLNHAESVSSFCNDVVGDICGIISGTTAAVIVLQLQSNLQLSNTLTSIIMTSLISAITIGGKALGKTTAIKQSVKVITAVAKFLAFFQKD